MTKVRYYDEREYRGRHDPNDPPAPVLEHEPLPAAPLLDLEPEEDGGDAAPAELRPEDRDIVEQVEDVLCSMTEDARRELLRRAARAQAQEDAA